MRLLLAWASLALLVAACGGDDDGATDSPGPTATPFASSDPGTAQALCDLLPNADIAEITGYAVVDKEPFSAVNTTLCTITLNVLGCNEECTVSVNDLGVPSDAAETSSEAFGASFQEIHSMAQPKYEDGVLGEGSWLGVTQTLYSGYELVYFMVGDHGYTVSGPFLDEDVLPEADIVEIASVLAANLGGS